MKPISRWMRLFLAVALADFAAAVPESAQIFIDSAGCAVESLYRMRRARLAGPLVAALLHILAPEKLTGWTRPGEKAEDAASFPNKGSRR